MNNRRRRRPSSRRTAIYNNNNNNNYDNNNNNNYDNDFNLINDKLQAKDAELKKKDSDYAALREQMKPLTVCVCVRVYIDIEIYRGALHRDRQTPRHRERERATESKRRQERCTQRLVRWKGENVLQADGRIWLCV